MTSKSPTLSVVVPISGMAGKLQNLKKWVEAAIELPIEIILVHDNNDNATAVELKEIQDSWPKFEDKIKLYTVNFGNPGETRNHGLDHVSGTWVQFVDSDDFVELSESLRAISCAKTLTEVIITNYQTISYETKKVQAKFHNSDLRQVAINPGIWRMIFRKKSIAATRFTNYRLGEDQLFLLDFHLFGRDLEFSEIQTYSYYVGFPNQLTSRRDLTQDLSQVLERAHQSICHSANKENRYIAIMLLKLFLTTIRINSFSNETLPIIKTAIKKLNWRDLFFMSKALTARLLKWHK